MFAVRALYGRRVRSIGALSWFNPPAVARVGRPTSSQVSRRMTLASTCNTAPNRDLGGEFDLERLVATLGVSERVIFPSDVGSEVSVDVGALAQRMAACDIHVLLYECGGWELTVLETGACGVPNIITDYAAPVEYAHPVFRTCAAGPSLVRPGGRDDARRPRCRTRGPRRPRRVRGEAQATGSGRCGDGRRVHMGHGRRGVARASEQDRRVEGAGVILRPLLVSNYSYPVGGGEVGLRMLAEALKARGHRAVVALPGEGPFAADLDRVVLRSRPEDMGHELREHSGSCSLIHTYSSMGFRHRRQCWDGASDRVPCPHSEPEPARLEDLGRERTSFSATLTQPLSASGTPRT